jgi:hypothetical protein
VAIEAALVHHLLAAALFHDFSMVDDHDMIRIADGAQALAQVFKKPLFSLIMLLRNNHFLEKHEH